MGSKMLYNVRHITDLKDMLEQSAELFRDKDAFRIRNADGSYQSIRYSQFKEDVDALGTALLDLGLKDGFVVVLGENRYEWCVSYLAVVNGTGVVVPVDKELPAADIENILLHSNAGAIIFSGKYAQLVQKISAGGTGGRYYINMDSDRDEGSFLSYRKLLERGRMLLETGLTGYTDAAMDRDKMSMLLFTSGTTGFSKGVMLSQRNVCAVILSVCSTVRVESTDSCLSVLPLHHTYECTIGFLAMIYVGSCITYNDSLRQIARNLKEVHPTILVTVPLLLENMYKKIWDQAAKKRGGKLLLRLAILLTAFLRIVAGIDLRKKVFHAVHENVGGQIRLIIAGAAAVDRKISRGFRNLGIQVLQGYGLTECAPLVIGNRDNAYRDGSVGLALPGVSVRIDQPDEKGVGEILVQGDMVMKGYFEDEAATCKCMTDGWLRTGDLGRMDKSGFVYITGRSKNVIVTKNGKNIYPEELEASINRNPLVQESLVVGKVDAETGDTYVHAQIFPNLDAIKEKLKVVNISADELRKVLDDVIKSVNKEMPLYKHIRQFSVRNSEFVKTTTQKIKRHLEQNSQNDCVY